MVRLGPDMVARLRDPRSCGRVAVSALLALLAGSAAYGAAFGWWRSWEQACYSTLKMPLLIVAVVTASGLINVMLGALLRSGLSGRQIGTCILLGLSVSCILLGALSPVVVFLVSQLPSSRSPHAMLLYRLLLPAHTIVVGLCGLAGLLRLYRLLAVLTGSGDLAVRLLRAWLLTTGLVGIELSWLFSPFLARPDLPVPFLNPNAFCGNFFEYLWRTLQGVL